MIVYLFLLIIYTYLKFLFPFLEELRLILRLKNAEDPETKDPEDRVPRVKESLWAGLTHLITSLFHFCVVIISNVFEESPIGVATIIGTEVLNNFL